MFCYPYSAINNYDKKYFQQNLVIVLSIYWKLSAQNFI